VRAARKSLVAASAVLAVAVLGLPGRARAYEDQVGLALAAGYAAVIVDGPLSPAGSAVPQHGFVLQAEASIGVGDTWEIRALAGWGMEVADTSLHRVNPGVELVYLLDILEVVPFLGLGVDAPISILGGEVWADFAGHAVVGFDWLLAREWSIGLEVRPYLLFTALARPAGDVAWLTATARVQYLFEI
jgi:hypothetical protein